MHIISKASYLLFADLNFYVIYPSSSLITDLWVINFLKRIYKISFRDSCFYTPLNKELFTFQ